MFTLRAFRRTPTKQPISHPTRDVLLNLGGGKKRADPAPFSLKYDACQNAGLNLCFSAASSLQSRDDVLVTSAVSKLNTLNLDVNERIQRHLGLN